MAASLYHLLVLTVNIVCVQNKATQIAELVAEKSELVAKQQHLENERLSLEAQRDDLKLHVEGNTLIS